MKTKSRFFLLPVLVIAILFVQCSDDQDEDVQPQTGTFALKLTDAPTDDAQVQGTFVTVSEVKIDGEPVEGFTRQTIEISAYQQGDAVLVLTGELEARTYGSITLVLDAESDEEGNSPGCYVLTDDNTKHDLSAGSQSTLETTFTGDFDLEAESENTWVIDFDLRKAVVRESDSSTETEYSFVAATEMQNALRIVKEENSGKIEGNVTGSLAGEDELYVYAYRKGEFDASSEIPEEDNGNVVFANAVTSARVQADGSYTLAFLEEGDYEIHVAAYEQSSNEESEFKAVVNANSLISGILLNNVTVTSESTVELDINILGIL